MINNLKLMKGKKIMLIIWIVVNLILLGKYIVDASTIQCEPCLTGQICPPCQTDYMRDIWYFLLTWNLVAVITWALFRRNQ